MDREKLNSQNPKEHDNTEKDLIHVTPAVLDNKLRDLESYEGAKGGMQGNITLVITLFVAVLTVVEFKDPLPPVITASAIRGTFIVFLMAMIFKTFADFQKIKALSRGIHTRTGIVEAFVKKDMETPKESKKVKEKKN